MFEQYIEASAGFLVVYSVEDTRSLETAARILERIYLLKEKASFRAVLLGNKVDSQRREVSQKEGQKVASRLGIKFFETSCLTGENVQVAFRNLVNSD